LDATDTPEAEWFILTGDLPMGVEKGRSRTVSIPPGQSRVVVVVLASREFPEFTGEESEYNDMLHGLSNPRPAPRSAAMPMSTRATNSGARPRSMAAPPRASSPPMSRAAPP
jgi:hypothetical protein